MKKIKFYLGIGYSGATHEEVVEYEENTTDEKIEEDFQEWENGYIDSNWSEAEE